MDEAEHVTDPHQLMSLSFQNHKMVKEVSSACVFDKNIELIDLKLDIFGPQEDLFYSTLPLLVQNVRRGNTIIKIQGEKECQYHIGRKGLMKFFDMRLDFVSKLERNFLNEKKHGCALNQEKNYILAPVLKTIADGGTVEVLKTLKANGENVQVSYSAETDAWVVTSKNVAILVRNTDDVKKYEE